MKRTSMIIKGLLLGISLLFFTSPAAVQAGTITFASDTTWAVSNPAGTFLGFAQDVCLNVTLFCHPTFFGIPGAREIWAPGITGATSPAFPAEFFFSKAFNLSGPPIAGIISVAVDDFAEVIVNGMSAGTTGSVTDVTLAGAAQLCCATFNITPFLVQGTNVITIRAANGPFGCGSGPYSCNPAGLYFGGSLQFQSIVPFDAFDAEVEIELGPLANDDAFEVKGTFSLGAGSNGIEILTEIVALELSGGSVTLSSTIPAGSFEFRPAKPGKKGKPGKPAEFRFEGVIDGVALGVKIIDLGVGMFEFKAEGAGADLAGIANPVTVQLTIGDDGSGTTVEAEFK